MAGSDQNLALEKPDQADGQETITRATFAEVFGAITLTTPTWTIIRHPLGFARYRANPGAAIHYLYSALGLVLIITKWTDVQKENDGGDAAPVLALVNRAIGSIGPNARLDGDDAIPVMLLIGNIIGGLTAYLVCRWLARRGDLSAIAGSASRATQTLAATAYLGGATSVVFAIGLLAAKGDSNAPASMAAGSIILFLVWCWGGWIKNIHGLRLGRTRSFFFPFVLSFGSLCIFAGLMASINFVLRL